MQNSSGFCMCLMFVVYMDARGFKILYWPSFAFLFGLGALLKPFLRENLFAADSSAVICCYCYGSFICVAVVCMCMASGGILSNLQMKPQPLECMVNLCLQLFLSLLWEQRFLPFAPHPFSDCSRYSQLS